MLSLTATELPRFMVCNGSKMLSGIEPLNTTSQITEEGIAVHWLVEQLFNDKFTADELIDRQAPNGVFITQEMVDDILPYLNDIKSLSDGAVEIDTSYGTDKWSIRGRADFIGFKADGTVVVADLKYGWRIVEPNNNWTLISHAIGSTCYPKDKIEFRIYQPRPYHPSGQIRTATMTGDELRERYEELATILDNPKPESVSSSFCSHCKSYTQCPAAQIALMNAIDVSNVAFDNELNDNDLSKLLKTLKRAKDVISQACAAYEELAVSRLSDGKILPGYQLTNALGRTKWTGKTEEIIEYVKLFCDIDVSEKTLITPAKALKMGVPEDVIKSCTERPCTGFKLVEMSENEMGEKLFGKKE